MDLAPHNLYVPEMQQNVGRYRILRPLGRGAMGAVFLAEDPSLNRQVAIKMLDMEADSESDRDFMRTRLLRDARAAAVLSHPNVVSVFDIVEEGKSVYVVMEYIEGESLASYLDHTPIADHSFIVLVLRQAAAALDYTHSRGIIHRDIKPGNIMISPGGGVKILDFGIARMNDVRTSTPTGVIMGTVDYMAPEQIKAVMVDGRADQFSLAAVAYRMLAGSTLFGRHSLATLAYKLVNEAPPRLCERVSEIPAAVDLVLARALAKMPADRYPTCSAFAEDLGRALSGRATELAPTSTVRLGAPVVETAPAGKKSSKMAALVTGGALLAAGAGGVAVWRPWVQTTQVSPSVVTPAETKPPETKPPESKPAETVAATPETKEPAKTPEHIAVTPPPTKTPTPSKKPATKETSPTTVTPSENSIKAQILKEPPTVPTPTPTTPPATNSPPTPPPPTPQSSQPEAQETPFKRGMEEIRTRNFQPAIESFTEVIGKHPRNVLAFYNRGFAYQMTGQTEKAIKDYSEAIRLGSRDARVYANRGICEVKLRQDELALSDFNKALELDPKYAGALNGRGGVYLRRRQFKMAIQEFTAAINANPEFQPAYENRANARRSTGDTAGADADMAVANRLQRKK
jgi:serine/threonine-protein kinase